MYDLFVVVTNRCGVLTQLQQEFYLKDGLMVTHLMLGSAVEFSLGHLECCSPQGGFCGALKSKLKMTYCMSFN